MKLKFLSVTLSFNLQKSFNWIHALFKNKPAVNMQKMLITKCYNNQNQRLKQIDAKRSKGIYLAEPSHFKN